MGVYWMGVVGMVGQLVASRAGQSQLGAQSQNRKMLRRGPSFSAIPWGAPGENDGHGDDVHDDVDYYWHRRRCYQHQLHGRWAFSTCLGWAASQTRIVSDLHNFDGLRCHYPSPSPSPWKCQCHLHQLSLEAASASQPLVFLDTEKTLDKSSTCVNKSEEAREIVEQVVFSAKSTFKSPTDLVYFRQTSILLFSLWVNQLLCARNSMAAFWTE